jgi:tetratricopeptide (TPR) repeat protein
LRGNLEEAESALGRAFLLSRDSEIQLLQPLVMYSLGNVYLQQGHAARARDILLQAKQQAEALGHATSMAMVPAYLGMAYSQLGDVERGLEMVRASQAGARQKGYPGVEALANLAEANIHALQGKPAAEEAIKCLKRTIEIATRIEAKPMLGVTRGMLARSLAASGRTAEARHELTQAIALFDGSKMTVHLERAKATLSGYSDKR